MKRILVALLVVLLAYPLLAWLTGVGVEARMQSFLDQSQATMPQLRRVQHEHHGGLTSRDDEVYELGPMLRLERHYRRGWYRTVDEGTIEVSGDAFKALGPAALGSGQASVSSPAPPRMLFTYRTVIRHGPMCGWSCFGFADFDTELRLGGELEPLAKLVPGSQPPLKMTGRLHFRGGGSAKFSSPAIGEIALADQSRLSWGGLEGTFRYGVRSDWYDLTASAPSLRVARADGGRIDVDGITLTGRSTRALRTVYAGETSLGLERLVVSQPGDARTVTLNQLLFVNRNEPHEGFLDASYRMGSGPIDSSSFKLASVHVDSTLKHLELESLANLTDAIRGANQSEDLGATPGARTAAIMAHIGPPLQGLLLKRPEWDIERVSAANGQGQALVTGVIRCPDLSAADFDAGAAVLQKIDARIDLAVDEAFLASLTTDSSLTAMLQPMIDQGYLARSNGSLRTEILFRRGLATVNGKPFAPGALPQTAPPAAPSAPPARAPAVRSRSNPGAPS